MTRGSIMIQSYGMNIILSYSLEEDKEVFLKTKYTFAKDNEHTICISTCTVAGSKESNEDAFSVIELDNSLVAAVFDGTSSLKPIQVLKDQTGARFASHFLKNELERGKSGPTINTMIRNLNKALLQKSMQFEDTVSKDIHTLPASTATLMQIIPDKDTIHLSHIGDSFCIVFFTDAHSEFMTIDRNRDYDNKMFEL